MKNHPILKNDKQKVRLVRHMGLFSCAMMLMGSIIGSGIFISPKGVLMNIGSLGMSLVVWLLCGIVSFMGSITVAELGTCIPQSGSSFIYLKTAFGELPAFLYLWSMVVIYLASILAILSLTVANYVLQPFFGSCSPPVAITNLVAAIAICLLTAINCYNVHWATRIQGILTMTKVSALILIIVAGVTHLIQGNTQNFNDVFQNTTTDPGFIALSFYSALYAYNGWDTLNKITEELKDPFVNLPRTIYISLPFVTIIYVLANVAYFAVLTTDEVLSSNAVAVTFGEHVLGPMSWIMPVLVSVALLGNLNGYIFKEARLLLVGAREGHLPKFLSLINIYYLTPIPSLTFLCIVGLGYLSTSAVYVLINYTTFANTIFQTLVVASLLWLRYKQPDMERPIKVNIIIPIAYFVVCLFLVAVPLYTRPGDTGISAAIILFGIPVYYGTVFWENKPKIYLFIIDKLTCLIQMLTMSAPEEQVESNKEMKVEAHLCVSCFPEVHQKPSNDFSSMTSRDQQIENLRLRSPTGHSPL